MLKIMESKAVRFEQSVKAYRFGLQAKPPHCVHGAVLQKVAGCDTIQS